MLDPRGQALDRYAEASLNFTPGSDVALLNAMINTIITEELYDKAYVDSAYRRFDALKLADQTAAMTPEAMAPVCGIEADVISDVARGFAGAKAGMIFWGMGVSQHTHGLIMPVVLSRLPCLPAMSGKHGAGLHPLRGQNNVQGASDAGLIPMFYPDYKPVTDADIRKQYEAVWNAELDTERGLTVVEIADAAYDAQLRAFM